MPLGIRNRAASTFGLASAQTIMASFADAPLVAESVFDVAFAVDWLAHPSSPVVGLGWVSRPTYQIAQS